MWEKSKLFHKKLKYSTKHQIEKYKTFANKYNNLKTETKKNYLRNMKVNLKENLPQTASIDNKQISNKGQIAQTFNNYFFSPILVNLQSRMSCNQTNNYKNL